MPFPSMRRPFAFFPLVVLLLAFLSISGPLLAKKADDAKALSAIVSSCKEIDSKVKTGELHGAYWIEVAGEGDARSWSPYASKEEAEKANSKGFWRAASVYQDPQGIRMVEMEIKTPTKEWVQNISYYFREDGTLEKAHSDFRTFGAYEKSQGPERQFIAKVIRDRFYDGKGKVIKRSIPKFSNATNHHEAHDVIFTDGPWPLFATASALPFSAAPAGAADPKKSK